MRRLLMALTLILLGAPASAGAAMVETSTYLECNGDPACEKYQGGTSEVALRFRAANGEANRVVMAPAGDGRVRVTDTGAPLQPGRTCEAQSPNEVLCPFPRAALIELGDGDDTASLALGPKTLVLGDAGADTLTGSPATEQLDGGPGPDRLDGGGGDDVLIGSLEGEPADALDGGDGIDIVSYSARRQPMVVSIAGAPSNPDVLARIEGLRGGAGDDVLEGTAGPDRLAGGDGDDGLTGAGGDDHLDGGPGNDALNGDAGNDVFAVFDATGDRIACGAGADRLESEVDLDAVYDDLSWRGSDPADLLAGDCERTALNGFAQEVDPVVVDPRVRLRGRRALLRNPCATIAARPCRGTVRVGRGARRVTRRFRAGTRRVVVRLPRTPQGTVRVRVRVLHGDEDHSGAWTADPRP